MPDENSAADEHAIIQEVTAPLASLPENLVPAVSDVEFPVALRGYDRLAVDAYVRRTSQLVAELQSTRSPEAAVRRALERVGEEVSGILQRAHEAAAQTTAQSRSEADNRLEMARQEAAQITADARNRLKELDAETDRIWAERHRIVEDARDLARQLLTLAESAAERFPAEDSEVEADGQAVEPAPGAALNGEDPAWGLPAEEPAFGGWPEDLDAGDTEPEPRAGEGGEPAPDRPPEPAEWPGHVGSAGDGESGGHDAGPSDPFADDITTVMPPIRPEEAEGSRWGTEGSREETEGSGRKTENS